MITGKEALQYRRKYQGVMEVKSRVGVKSGKDLELVYTPGVAWASEEIHKNGRKILDYTNCGNTVAIITDGSAVLGLGDIGPAAALPVMEGKAVLFKVLANIDAYPICLDTQEINKIIETVKLISPGFSGINLEDISSPRCFQIESELRRQLNIPVFHDDQHGTAVVVLAGLINALKIVQKKISEIKVVINGAGAGGIAVTKFLLSAGVKDVVLSDRNGAIYQGRRENMNTAKKEIAHLTNKERIKGNLAEAMKGRDVFIGLSSGNLVNKKMVQSMAKDAIVFALANPVPEIMPDRAKEAGAKVVATGRSNLANQINNALAFPGIFRGALDARAKKISEEMKMAASFAIARLIAQNKLQPDYIIPHPLDKRVVPAVARAVLQASKK